MNSSRATETDPFESELPSIVMTPQRDVDLGYSIRRRLALVLIITLVCAIPSALACWFLIPPEYTAEADIQFLTVAPRVMDAEGGNPFSMSYDKFVSTQLLLLTGNTILSKVVDDDEIRSLPILKGVRDPARFLAKHMDARMSRDSELVTVTCTLEQRDAARLILKKVVETYQKYTYDQEGKIAGDRALALRNERTSRASDIETLQNLITQLESAAKLQAGGELGAEADMYRQNLLSAQDALAQLDNQVSVLQQQNERVQGIQKQNKQSPGQPILELGIEDRVNSDAKVAALIQELTSARIALEARQSVYTDPARSRQEQSRVETVKSSLEDMRKQVRRDAVAATLAEISRRIEDIKSQQPEAQARVKKYESLLAEYAKSADKRSAQYAKIEELKAQLQRDSSWLQQIDNQIAELQLESKLQNPKEQAPARIRFFGDPRVPLDPESRKRLIAVGLAIMASLGLGVMAGVVREVTDKQLGSPQDLARITRYPVIACIPQSKDDPLVSTKALPLHAAEQGDSMSADQFRRILSSILFPHDGTVTLSSILVVSPTRGDGKTTLACNLGLALAQSGRRVLLVDLNHRHPDVEVRFGLEPGPGLTEMLEGRCAGGDAARATEAENLYVMGPGLKPNGLARKLASEGFVKFLEQAEHNFSHVICDSPPLLLTSEANLLSPLVDGVIVVVGGGVSQAGMVQHCLQHLTQQGANVIGIVLNKARRMGSDYLKDAYQLYYANGSKNGKGSHANGAETEDDFASSQHDEPTPETVKAVWLPDSASGSREGRDT